MKLFFILFVSHLVFAASPDDLIDIKTFDYSIRLDIKYATAYNFTHKALYPEPRCLLRREVAEALSRVQTNIKMDGLSLKVYDCYRPLSVQKKMWEIKPDDRYVSDPKLGSKHNRGAAVDLTLVDAMGHDVEMPTGYDDFTEKAHRDYQGGTLESKKNRKRLQDAMTREGFIGIPTEWWHFDYKDWEKFPIEDVSFSSVK